MTKPGAERGYIPRASCCDTAPRAVRHHGDGPVRGDEGSRMSNAARSIAAAEPPGERTIRRVIFAAAAILWPFGTLDLPPFWHGSIKLYDFYTPNPAKTGADYITQNASKRGFFANHSGMRRRSPPNGRKGIRASDTRLSSRGPHSGRWCATGAPHPGTGVPWRGSYAVSLLPAPFPRYGAPRVPLGKA